MSHIGVRLVEAARRLVDLGTLGFVCPFHNLATKTLYYGSTEIDLATLIACPTWPHSAAASVAASSCFLAAFHSAAAIRMRSGLGTPALANSCIRDLMESQYFSWLGGEFARHLPLFFLFA